jgi:hypothetical protein
MKETATMSLSMRMHRARTIENIYKVMGCREDYINPTTNGELSWRSVKSYDMDSEDALDRWKNNIYEVSTRRCAHISMEEHVEDRSSYGYYECTSLA